MVVQRLPPQPGHPKPGDNVNGYAIYNRKTPFPGE